MDIVECSNENEADSQEDASDMSVTYRAKESELEDVQADKLWMEMDKATSAQVNEDSGVTRFV